MKRKTKLFFSLVSLCFSLAVLCFGVYSAMQVSYTVSGSVSYEISDVFVDIETSLYMSTLNELTTDDVLKQNIQSIENDFTQSTSNTKNIVKHTVYGTSEYSSYTQEGGFDTTLNPSSKTLPIKYGSYIANDSAYAYYVVIKVTNNAQNEIYASLNLHLQDITEQQLNSVVDMNQSIVNISGNQTTYFVVGMALDDATIGVENQQFNWTLKITTEEIVPYFENDPQFDKPRGLSMAIGNSEDYVDISNSGIDEEILPENKTNISIDIGNGLQTFYIAKSEINIAPDLDYLSATIDVASDNEIMAMIVLDGVDYTVNDVLSIAMDIFMTPNYTNENLICSVMSPDAMTISFLEIPQSNTFTVGIAGLSELNSIHYSSTYSTLYNSVFYANLTQTLTFDNKSADMIFLSRGKLAYANYVINDIPEDCRYLTLKGNEIFKSILENDSLSDDTNFMVLLPGKVIDGSYIFKNINNNIYEYLFLYSVGWSPLIHLAYNNEIYLDLEYAKNGKLEFCCLYFVSDNSNFMQQIEANNGQLTFSNTFSFSKDTSEVAYRLKDDDTYEVVGLKTLVFEDDEISCLHNHMIEIPEEFNGKPVTLVRYQAFSQNDVLLPSPTSVVLPDTITSIESQAFFSTFVESIYIQGQNVIDKVFVDDGSGDTYYVAGGMCSYGGVINIYIEKSVTLNQFLLDNLQDSGEEVTLNGVVYKLYKNKNM